jgi:hypothetical protein
MIISSFSMLPKDTDHRTLFPKIDARNGGEIRYNGTLLAFSIGIMIIVATLPSRPRQLPVESRRCTNGIFPGHSSDFKIPIRRFG